MKTLVKYILLCSIILLLSCSGDTDNITQENNLVFSSTPIKTIDHNKEYKYQITINDNTTSYSVNLPSWLTFNANTNIISGTADWVNVGKNFNITITAISNSGSATQSYNLSVLLGEIICNQNFGDPQESPYILPWNAGEEYKLIQSYCPSNPAWGHHNWFAYDFEMPIGTTILASRAGEVIAVRELNPDVSDCSGGKENFVFILHADGTVMSYVHLKQNSVAVNTGESVEQGQILGLSGNSGCSSGPHTHIALFKDRTNFDRQSTIPFNYSNTNGSLDSNNGLLQDKLFSAL